MSGRRARSRPGYPTLPAFTFSAAATSLFLPGWLTQQPHGLLQQPGTDQGWYLQRALLRARQGEERPRSEPATAELPPGATTTTTFLPHSSRGSAGKGDTVLSQDARSCGRQRAAAQAVTRVTGRRRGRGQGRDTPGVPPTPLGPRRPRARARAPASPQRGGGGAARHAITAATGAPLPAPFPRRFPLPRPLPAPC